MELEWKRQSIEALSLLLKNPSEEEEVYCTSSTSLRIPGPGDIVPKEKTNLTDSAKSEQRNSKEIWHETEVREEMIDTFDYRLQPKYDILFKQNVRSEDVFLGFSGKDPSTSCCEDMVVRIQLPGTNASDVSLQLKNKFLDICTPKFKLGLHLPYPVDEENGKAEFLLGTKTLEVTLTRI